MLNAVRESDRIYKVANIKFGDGSVFAVLGRSGFCNLVAVCGASLNEGSRSGARWCGEFVTPCV